MWTSVCFLLSLIQVLVLFQLHRCFCLLKICIHKGFIYTIYLYNRYLKVYLNLLYLVHTKRFCSRVAIILQKKPPKNRLAENSLCILFPWYCVLCLQPKCHFHWHYASSQCCKGVLNLSLLMHHGKLWYVCCSFWQQYLISVCFYEKWVKHKNCTWSLFYSLCCAEIDFNSARCKFPCLFYCHYMSFSQQVYKSCSTCCYFFKIFFK